MARIARFCKRERGRGSSARNPGPRGALTEGRGAGTEAPEEGAQMAEKKPDDTPRDPKQPTHAPGEDAVPGRTGPKPYPVDDPELTDPGKTRGAEPDVRPIRPATPGTM